MSETVIEALDAARAAYERATEALQLATSAARAADVEVAPLVIDELTVKRVNVVEDDGMLRMVIGNSAHATLMPIRGRMTRQPHRRPATGILFVDDEGTECGGIQYYGGRTTDGPDHGGYLTVDDYEQQESFRLGQRQDPKGSTKFVEFLDRPAWSLADLVDELDDADAADAPEIQDRHVGRDGYGVSRLRLFRDPDSSVGLVLRDARGRDRLRLVVPADGEPVIEILDVDGVPRSLVPD